MTSCGVGGGGGSDLSNSKGDPLPPGRHIPLPHLTIREAAMQYVPDHPRAVADVTSS